MPFLRKLCQTLPVYSHPVDFVVHVPEGTPSDQKVFISGACWMLGEWTGDGLPLKQVEKGVWRRRVFVPSNQPLEFKVTRGSWDSVERHADGSETGNHYVDPTQFGGEVFHKVERWADAA